MSALALRMPLYVLYPLSRELWVRRQLVTELLIYWKSKKQLSKTGEGTSISIWWLDDARVWDVIACRLEFGLCMYVYPSTLQLCSCVWEWEREREREVGRRRKLKRGGWVEVILKYDYWAESCFKRAKVFSWVKAYLPEFLGEVHDCLSFEVREEFVNWARDNLGHGEWFPASQAFSFCTLEPSFITSLYFDDIQVTFTNCCSD